jgi:hypothetical protein
MIRRRTHRLATVIAVVLSLLFSQLALANYVHPVAAAAASGIDAVAAMDMDMEMADGAPCPVMDAMSHAPMRMDKSQPLLCHQQCVNAPQTFEPMKAPVVSLPAVMQVLLVPMALDIATQQQGEFAALAQPQPPPDPIFLSTLRLRV